MVLVGILQLFSNLSKGEILLKKTIFVTGASGFIGKETVLAFEKSGFNVIRGVRSNINNQIHDNDQIINLNNPKSILELEHTLHCDAIVHLGARVGLTEDLESDLFVPNVLSSACLAYLAKAWDAKIFFSSSVMVHGVRNTNIHLQSPINPDTPYGVSKWLAEQLIQTSGVQHCIFRIGGVFGNDGPIHLGLNRAIHDAQQGISPTMIGYGKALRNYVYVKDVAEAIVYAIQNNLQGIHLVAGNQKLSIQQMLQLICNTFLPSSVPINKSGSEALDQVIITSPQLPKTRPFLEALIDIKKGSEF